MATVLTLTANPLLDHVVETVLRPGMVQRIGRFQATAGGKGLNVGRVLARHGHRVIATGFLGGWTGEQVRRLVETDGLIPAFTEVSDSTRIGFLVADPEARTTTSLMERGPEIQGEEIDSLLGVIEDRLGDADLVIIGGAPSCPACRSLYRLTLDLCAAARVPCWVDAHGPAMDSALEGLNPPELVKPNKQEYGSDGAKWLRARELHLTDGAQEIRILAPEGRFRVTPPKVREINPVGSGDCYLAALAHARLENRPLRDQIRYAVAAGAANAASLAVAALGPAEIGPYIAGVEVRDAD